MVFGADIMVTVAKELNYPMMLLVPRTSKFMLLGLGDIVIPAWFIALCLNYDFFRQGDLVGKDNKGFDFPKPYFHSAMAGYILGLISTFTSLFVFQVAQVIFD
jgi:minor histocompatibility antigen H13